MRWERSGNEHCANKALRTDALRAPPSAHVGRQNRNLSEAGVIPSIPSGAIIPRDHEGRDFSGTLDFT